MNQFCWNLARVGGICTFLDGEMLSAKESHQLGPELGSVCVCVRACVLACVCAFYLWTQAEFLSQGA